MDNFNVTNKTIDLAKLYDYYEVELRDMYRTISKPQNESHFKMLQSKGEKYFRQDKVFCEIGFSAGLTLRYALNHFSKVYGLDISPKNVEFTKNELKNEGYNNFELYFSDLMKFDPVFENKFDIISFINGLEHFTDSDYSIILSNIKRYLRPGGIFTGALPFKNRFNYRMCPECNHVFETDGHVSSHDLNSLEGVFLKNDFEIIHLDNFNFKYTLSSGSVLRRVYRFLSHYLLLKPSTNQIEFIVKVV